MKVLMIVTSLNIGGTESYTISLAQALKSLGVEVGIATTGGPLSAACSRKGIPLHLIPGRSYSARKVGEALSKIVSFGRYQVIHAHDSSAYRALVGLSHFRKVKSVLTVHGTYHEKGYLKQAAKLSGHVITVSPRLSTWVHKAGVPLHKINMITNGIDTTYYAPSSQKLKWRKQLNLPLKGKMIAYAGRFSPDKQHIAKMVILSSGKVVKIHPSLTTLLVGPGVYGKKLLNIAIQVNQRVGRKAVLVRKAMEKLRPLYCAADIVVGTGRVALEAMSCGKPVVAVGVAGYHGIVNPFNVEKAIRGNFGDHSSVTKSSIEIITRDVNFLLAHPQRAAALGQFGRNLVYKRFAVRRIASQLIQMYSNL